MLSAVLNNSFPNRGGRPKGTPNKVSADIRQMIIMALSKAGGVDYLVQCAREQPSAFLTLVGKILPNTFESGDGSPIHLHLLAATSVSQEMLSESRQPPTIDVTRVDLRNAPLPLE